MFKYPQATTETKGHCNVFIKLKFIERDKRFDSLPFDELGHKEPNGVV